MDNNLFQTIFDKYSHSIPIKAGEETDDKYLCETDAPKAMREYAIEFAKWMAENVGSSYFIDGDGRFTCDCAVDPNELLSSADLFELFNNQQ